MAESKIKLFCECMESDVKPLMYDEIFEGLMDLLHLAIIESYEKGRRAGNRKMEGLKMAENKMGAVAQIFGKKLGEPFEVGVCGELKSKHHKCKLTEGGLYEWYEDWQKWVFDPDGILLDLLTGDAIVEE